MDEGRSEGYRDRLEGGRVNRKGMKPSEEGESGRERRKKTAQREDGGKYEGRETRTKKEREATKRDEGREKRRRPLGVGRAGGQEVGVAQNNSG